MQRGVVQGLPGVTDVRFAPHQPETLGLALSNGSIALYKLCADPVLELVHWRTLALFSDSTVVLSLEFHPDVSTLFGVTLSTGQTWLFQFSHHDRWRVEALRLPLDNAFQSWSMVFAYYDEEPEGKTGLTRDLAVYACGDDGAIRGAVFPALGSCLAQSAPTALVPFRNAHQYGVTALLPLHVDLQLRRHHVLVTGGFDQNICVYDTALREVVAKEDLGGGVWKFRVLDSSTAPILTESRESIQQSSAPSQRTRVSILASCMEAGAQVVELVHTTQGAWEVNVLAKFEDHDGMVYASEGVCTHQDPQTNCREYTCISTSFQDRRLCVWAYEERLLEAVTPLK